MAFLGEMSKQTEVLEIDKCISSRLWYTSLNVSYDSNFLKEVGWDCCVKLTELEAVVDTLM